MITLTQGNNNIQKYTLEYCQNNTWYPIFSGTNSETIKIHRFDRVWANKVRITIEEFTAPPSIAEFGVYNERR